ncbi:hypothetical protein NFJ02_24g55240 [Pycnococcus provasolii]
MRVSGRSPVAATSRVHQPVSVLSRHRMSRWHPVRALFGAPSPASSSSSRLLQDFSVAMKGAQVPLSKYCENKVCLVVNVASK